jgi:hypothetical protein
MVNQGSRSLRQMGEPNDQLETSRQPLAMSHQPWRVF